MLPGTMSVLNTVATRRVPSLLDAIDVQARSPAAPLREIQVIP
jgi:hypothetical protein